MARIAAVSVVFGALLGAVPAFILAVLPAQAQFGGFNNDSPPRPPASVPGFPSQPPPVQYPGQSYPSQQQQYAPPPQQAARPPQSNIQARPLAPPPGAASAPQQANVPRPLPGPPGSAPGPA